MYTYYVKQNLIKLLKLLESNLAFRKETNTGKFGMRNLKRRIVKTHHEEKESLDRQIDSFETLAFDLFRKRFSIERTRTPYLLH